MKRIIILLISVILPCVIFAQVQTYVQKGIVRSQSFASKKGTGIVGAIIVRSGNNESSVISLDIPQKGYFELPMDNMGESKIYYISSVKSPKGTRYKLMYPLSTEKLEFTPNAPLTIIMQSNEELDEYAAYVKKNALKEAKIKSDREKQTLEEKYLAGQVSLIEKERIIEELNKKLNDFEGLILDHIYETLKNTDFEQLDSLHQVSSIAIESGNFALADSLLNLRSDSIWIDDLYRAEKKAENSQNLADIDRNNVERQRKINIEHFNQKIKSALYKFDFDEALIQMKNRLLNDTTNISYLCQIGELLEIRYNDYHQALKYYQKALLNATIAKDYDAIVTAICHNHLGDVYNSLSEFALAEEHYSQARLILESSKGELPQEIYDSYLGLGNVSYPQAKFGEALKFYEKCSAPDVAFINRKAYWQGRIGIGRMKLAKGDYHGAKSDFSAILNEIVSIQDIDVVTLNQAYNSMIECMATIGQYQTAIDSCNAAIKIIKKLSSPRNTYIADLLVQQGNAYINIGKIREGEQCMNDAIEIYKNILGENHPNYASACVMFANYYNLIGDLRKSEEMSNKALALLDKKFGKNHLTTVAAHFSRCQLYQTYGEFGKAQAELDAIRTIYKSSGLLNNYNRIQINISEGALKIAQGEESKVLKLYQEGIDCVTKSLGNESVQLISLYNKMAMTYLGQQDNNRAKQYLDKAQSLANLIYGVDSPTAIMQQMGMGQYYVNRGDYHKAYNLYSKIERTIVEIFGADNHQLCNIYNLLGDYHLGQYQFNKAKYYYDKLYEIVRNTYGENHYFVAEPITKIGAYFIQIGDFRKGLEKEQQAYNILSNHFDVGHEAALQSQLGICSAYIQLGQFDQAESVLIELSKAVEKKLGKNHSMYSSVLQIKATLHQSKGEFSKAIEYVEEAISIQEAIYGRYHSNTIQLYEQLSGLYSNLCNFSKAMEYNDVALAIATKYYGKDNVGVMPHLLTKGQFCANFNQIKEARGFYDKVKSVYIRNFGDSCKQLNIVLISEAQLLMQEGYAEQALEILKNVETQMISIYDENSVQMCGVYNPIADAYRSVMQYKNARVYYQKSIDIIKEFLGDNNVNCIYPLVGLGNVCISEDATGQQIEEAYRLFNRASFISTSIYGSNNSNTANIDAMLGQISLRQGNLQDAYNKFQKYGISVRQTLGDSISAHTRIADAHMNMGYYYMAKASEASCGQDSVNTHHFALQAMKEFEKAQTITEKIYGGDYAGIATPLYAIAQTHFMLQHPDSAITTYFKASELTIKQFGKQSPLAAQAYATLGAAYKYESDQIYMGDEDKLTDAKECYLKAITIRENSKGNSKEILMTATMDWRMNLAAIYMKLYDYENAFKTIDKIIYELEGLQLDNKYALYNCLCTKASMIVESERDAEDALEILLKAKDLFSQLPFPNNLMKEMQQFQLMCAFGNVYEKIGMQNEAIESFETAYSRLRSFPNYPQVESMKQEIKDKIQELKSE